MCLVLFVGFMMLTSGASAATMFFYGQNLPTLKNFKARFEFQNSLIRDSQGHVLYDMADLSSARGKRVVERLVDTHHPTSYFVAHHDDWLVGPDDGRGIPPVLQDATIATEDASFYNNLGFDPLSIVRAAYDDFTTHHIVSGASTITQQLVKEYMLHPDPSFSRKAEEIVLAAELTQKYPKSKILWYYLNSVPYGNLSRGAQAAAKTYFNENVWKLDLAQSALLAGLPQAPSVYNPVDNLPTAENRMREVLHLMYIHGYLRQPQLIGRYAQNPQQLDEQELIDSVMTSKEVKSWRFVPAQTVKTFPHFVEYAINELQNIPQLKGKIYTGLDVYTTLNPVLQRQAQNVVTNQVSQLGGYHVTDGALVSIDLRKSCYGCILAMVGSADYKNVAISGQINMATSPRQPGSSFKPFNYIYAFQHGLSPATSVLDAPIAIPDTGNAADGGWYEPKDYDLLWHGSVTIRTALQNSLNIPAVKVEQYDSSVGGSVRDTVGQQAVNMGIKSLFSDNPHCCGWATTLGGMERGVRLVEETSAYGTFGTLGKTVPPISIRKVYDRTTGKLLYDAATDGPKGTQAVPPPYAYVMNNVLSDNQSRCTPAVCEFGLDSSLNLGRPVAAKTGTTTSFTDNWTVGYTPDIVTGVWVGNADNSPMVNSTGITGAAPIWHDYMLQAFQTLNLPPKVFPQPSGVDAGTTCRLPGAYAAYSSMGYDIFAGIVPYCSVGSSYSSTLPVPPQQQSVPYQPPVQQAPVQQQATQPAALPTAAPVQQAPVQQSPVQQPPAQPTQPTAGQQNPTQPSNPSTGIPGVQPSP
ncbi:MAG TPA: transglycosylase domain-containing protein [Chloroflexota bacterium]